MMTTLRNGILRVAAQLAPDALSDGELLARYLAAGDDSTFAVLVRRHANMVFGTCRRILGNAADADDAFQAVFVVLIRRASSFTDRACVGNFLYGVACHAALKAKAMAAKRRLREANAAPPPDSTPDAELLKILDEELAKLPEKYREPVVLCELEGIGRKETAARLNIPEGTISSRLATAHRMLEKRLKARGFAGVMLGAVLANPTVSATPALVSAAIQTATLGPTAGVAPLVTEILKMMFLSKLKFNGMILVAACGLVLSGGMIAMPGGPGIVQGEDKPGAPLAEDPVKVPTETKPAVGLDPLIAKLLKEDPKDDELRKLMKARCVGLAAIRKQMEGRLGAIATEDFTGQVTDLELTTQRYLQGCLELADGMENKLSILKQCVQFAKDLESKIEQRTSNGVGAPYILTRAQCNRMDVEIQLLRVKKEAEKAK